MEAREIRERNFNLPFSLTSLISLCSLPELAYPRVNPKYASSRVDSPR